MQGLEFPRAPAHRARAPSFTCSPTGAGSPSACPPSSPASACWRATPSTVQAVAFRARGHRGRACCWPPGRGRDRPALGSRQRARGALPGGARGPEFAVVSMPRAPARSRRGEADARGRGVCGVAFSPNGRWLAAAGADGPSASGARIDASPDSPPHWREAFCLRGPRRGRPLRRLQPDGKSRSPAAATTNHPALGGRRRPGGRAPGAGLLGHRHRPRLLPARPAARLRQRGPPGAALGRRRRTGRSGGWRATRPRSAPSPSAPGDRRPRARLRRRRPDGPRLGRRHRPRGPPPGPATPARSLPPPSAPTGLLASASADLTARPLELGRRPGSPPPHRPHRRRHQPRLQPQGGPPPRHRQLEPVPASASGKSAPRQPLPVTAGFLAARRAGGRPLTGGELPVPGGGEGRRTRWNGGRLAGPAANSRSSGSGASWSGRDARRKRRASVAEAVDRGVNYFDVAPSYGNAEERLGPALEPYRDRLSSSPARPASGPRRGRGDCASRCARLRTDHFDLYQLPRD